MPINNQVDLARRALDQALHEFDEGRVLELTLEDHEAQRPSIGDGRDHVATEAFACRAHNGRLSLRAKLVPLM